MRYSALTTRIAGEGSDAWQVHDDALARVAAGEDVIVLSIGDPDFDTALDIREAAVRALGSGRTHYAGIGGEPALRHAIAAHTKRTTGVTVSPDDITVFPGAQATLFAVAQCLVDPGDEVVVVEPTYVTYEAVVGAPGGRLVQVPVRPEQRFHLEPEALARAITPRTKALLLNFPHNPTGASLSAAEAQAAADVAKAHDLWLISDEVYAALADDGVHTSPFALADMRERSVLISSLSKSHAMTGWRVGWAVTPPEMAEHLRRLARAMFFGLPPFVQDAAAHALTHGGQELNRLRAAYRARADVVVAGLASAHGVYARGPDAGMYIFADVRGTGLNGKQFARGLLDDYGVSVTPGEGFGPSGAGHVRITLGTGEARLAEACARIVQFCAALRD